MRKSGDTGSDSFLNSFLKILNVECARSITHNLTKGSFFRPCESLQGFQWSDDPSPQNKQDHKNNKKCARTGGASDTVTVTSNKKKV